MNLCLYCIKRNKLKQKPVKDEECELCEGYSKKFEKLIKKIKINDSFSLSTHIPKKWEIKEEELWDKKFGTSIKADFNKKIVKKINVKYSPNKGKFHIDVDVVNEKIEIKLNDLFIFGRYKKFKPGLSQSRWIDKEGNKKYISIEEIIGEKIVGESHGEFILHASGREDVDVTNIAGRPFVMQIKNPKKIPNLNELGERINKNPFGVVVEGLKYVHRGWVELVGSSHFDKTYIAEIEMEKKPESIEKILELKNKIIKQRTPIRVKHRRADKIRKRKILDIKIIKKEPLTLEIKAEAGTYIKELISGDEGRTKPSISEILGVKAVCKKLIVKNINDDFLNIIKG